MVTSSLKKAAEISKITGEKPFARLHAKRSALGGTTDPLPDPAERNKRWKKVGENRWREIKEGITGKTVPGRPWRELYDKKEASFREKKHQDWVKKQGFDVKRDKGGKGFSMMIGKKIKGFESKEEDMGKLIDEAEGIKTVSTKGYTGSRKSKPEHRPGTKGFVNFKGGKPAGADDEKVLSYHRGEAAKQGKVVQLRYRGPRSHEGRQTYNPGASQIRGAATGAAIYYKNKDELGGRQRDKARAERHKANEENEEMNEDGHWREPGEKRWPVRKLGKNWKEPKVVKEPALRLKEATRKEETEMNEDGRWPTKYEPNRWPVRKLGKNWKEPKVVKEPALRLKPTKKATRKEETEVEPNVSNLILNAMEQKPLDFQQSFADLMQQRIEDAVEQEKLAIATNFIGVGNTDPDEFDNDNIDDDWDGTEWEGDEEDDEETLNAEEEDENG